MATGVALKSLATGTEWDLSGDALSGRSVYVGVRGCTISGTSGNYSVASGSQVTVYQDAALTTPYTQPLQTGADGTAGAIPGYVAAGQSIDFVDALTGSRAQAEPLLASSVESAIPTATVTRNSGGQITAVTYGSLPSHTLNNIVRDGQNRVTSFQLDGTTHTITRSSAGLVTAVS